VLTNAAREGARLAVMPSPVPGAVDTRVRSYLTSGQLDPTAIANATVVVDPATTVDIGGGATATASLVTVSYPFEFMVLQPVASLLVAGSTPAANHADATRRCATNRSNRGVPDLWLACEYSWCSCWRSPPAAHWRLPLTTTFSVSRPGRSRFRRARSSSPPSDLDIGAELRREDIRIIDWPANAVPANALSDPKTSSAAASFCRSFENEPILPMKLASKEAGSGLPPAIPPGLRAVSVASTSDRRRRLRACRALEWMSSPRSARAARAST
jgi:hypothetical protein